MAATILVTIPKKIGDPTYYTSTWGEKMVSVARKMGYKVVTLKGDNVTYRNTTAAIEKYHPRLYVHTGHGCQAHLTGQRECILTRKFEVEELLSMGHEKLDKLLNPVRLGSSKGCGEDVCKLENDLCNPICLLDTNIHLLKDSIVYAVSCHSAERLGKCAITYGIQSYIGYNDLLLFPVDSMRSQNMFGDIHVEFLKNLLEGSTVEEANDNVSIMEDTYIRFYKKIKWVALPMLWNAMHRRVLGNRYARIYE